MNIRTCVAIVVLLSSAGAVAAQERENAAPNAPGLFDFKGTPEEQAACAPDSTRFCKDDIPDTFRVLACLKDNRAKLRKACQKVLEDNGQ